MVFDLVMLPREETKVVEPPGRIGTCRTQRVSRLVETEAVGCCFGVLTIGN